MLEPRNAPQADRLARQQGPKPEPLWSWLGACLAALSITLGTLVAVGPGCTDCAEQPPIMLPEKAAGLVTQAIREQMGAELAAVTPPGACPLYFVNPLEDPCLVKHELEHVDQALAEPAIGPLPGPAVWAIRYTLELKLCWIPKRLARDAFLPCYMAVSYEQEAQAVQDACAAGAP